MAYNSMKQMQHVGFWQYFAFKLTDWKNNSKVNFQSRLDTRLFFHKPSIPENKNTTREMCPQALHFTLCPIQVINLNKLFLNENLKSASI